MSKAIVLGAAGMLGSDVVAELDRRGWGVEAVDLPQLDVTDPVQVAGIASGEFGKLDWCVNCAAYTAVDKAESEEDLAFAVNALAPGYISQACAFGGIRLLHVSTDFVFDGDRSSPYTEEDAPRPLGVYGRTKLEGEEAAAGAVIVRTAWLYGPHGKCFPKTMARMWEAGQPLRVVSDQTGNPTYTGDLARVLVDLMDRQAPPGVYHAAGVDTMSWHAFAKLALQVLSESRKLDLPVEIEPIRTEDWPTRAQRPKFSALSFAKCAALGVEPMRPTRGALREFWSRVGASEVGKE